MDNEWNLYKVNMKYIRNLKNVEQKAVSAEKTTDGIALENSQVRVNKADHF